ncbi:MAG: DEAD/DEAH box helicase [Faecalibacterium sp.]|nr:DEAD/DEAH box helicase [Faecalibacterium sp.]
MPYILRDYQKECVDAMRQYEGQAALCVLATGLGKSVIFSEYLRRGVLEDDHRFLLLSHRDELVHQPLCYLDGVSVGCEIAAEHSRHQAVISASVQTLVGRLNEFNPREFDAIIIDEAHHAAAPTYRKILDYFSGCQVFGFTATAHRGDGQGLDCVFQDIIFERTVNWGIEQGYLCPITCKQVKLKYDLGTVKIQPNGDFSPEEIATAMSGTAAAVAEVYQKYAKGQTIIFACNVSEAKEISDCINRAAHRRIACTITDKTKNRRALLEGFSQGILHVLVNFSVLTEGIDLPCTETVLIARPIAHTNVGVYAQMVGRGLRLSPGKACCTVIDCVGISNAPICTAATLIGRDKPTGTDKAAELPDTPQDEKTLHILQENEIPDTWIDKETDISVLEKAIGTDRHEVAWNKMPDGCLLLDVGNTCFQLKPSDTPPLCCLTQNGTEVAQLSLQQGLDYVYLFCKAQYPGLCRVWNRRQRSQWANEPMTNNQYQLLRQLAPGYPIDSHKMTKGTACDLIQRLSYDKNSQKGEPQNAKTATV